MDPASRRVIEHAPLVLVSFDGTLTSLRVDHAALETRLASLCEIRSWPWSELGSLDDNLRRVRARYGEASFNRLCNEVAEAEVAGFSPQAVATELIEILRDRAGEPTAIVTNDTKVGVLSMLQHSVFDGVRARVIGLEDVHESKPSPQGLLRACRLYVASPKTTVFVGNSDRDALAARAAGIGIFLRVDPPRSGTLRLAA